VIGDLPKDEAERYITWKKSGRERKMTALLCLFAKAAPKEDAPRAGPPTAGLNFGFKQEASTKVGIGANGREVGACRLGVRHWNVDSQKKAPPERG
jgi:hypothetical protein